MKTQAQKATKTPTPNEVGAFIYFNLKINYLIFMELNFNSTAKRPFRRLI